MTALPIIIGAVCVLGFPIAWLVAEFKAGRLARIVLGILAILSACGIAAIIGGLQRLSYNAWYGFASKELVDATVSQIEAGRTDVVVLHLKELQNQFKPTCEYRAHYDELVRETVQKMKESGNTR